ncbi:uncharacterized protein PGTG_15801 [Puccinia graminis f. sp. tritici CRL 75-36-700-3]|uniref:EH domain-containing protein n=1 Tax=Puccinia graminis f. sp. tritici (strain CRL 75-36-700-3 / race SCCL) TaxID=418459 RepID=E3KZW4_PUCGT|nr:uncharacterized protein PGTG_15801 [Puccinia graminis f. sp. tritici CRL 75-36-700-3]EFP89845.1 hypothetical protein PGTG_15801 [Puccinia graminis f. sp. tritici CRL 75-36-700-3]
MTTINQLISFYNNNNQNQQQIPDPSSSNTRPATKTSVDSDHHSKEPLLLRLPPKKKIGSEECYQIDLQQWLSLGQPQPTTPPKQEQIKVPACTRRSVSRSPPPVPPRKTHTHSTQTIPADSQPSPKEEAEEEEEGPPIDLGCFRKAIQALWTTLIHQHFHHHLLHSSSSASSYYDLNNQKIKLPGSLIRAVWIRSGLPLQTLAHIWESIDQQKTGGLNFEQFLLGTYQISKLRQAQALKTRKPAQTAHPENRRRTSESKGGEREEEGGSEMRRMRRMPTSGGRRTPPLVPSSRPASSRSASVCSSSNDEASLLDHPISLNHPVIHFHHLHHPADLFIPFQISPSPFLKSHPSL